MSIYKLKDYIPESDYIKLIDFLKVAWNPNHSLVKSKVLMDFQHYDPEKKGYNFIVAENQMTGEFDALVGYIPTSQYDKKLKENGDYWGAIWKRKENVENDEISTMGSDVFLRLFSLPYFHTECGISLSKYAVKACKAMRYHFGYMHQYYIINREKKEFRIADHVSNNNYLDASQNKEESWEIKPIRINDDDVNNIKPVYKPYKSITFLQNRYGLHPIYHYDFFGLYKKRTLKAILVTRSINVNGSRVLRIVDAFGQIGGYIYNSIHDILTEGDYEYVDFLNYGINATVFRDMGFQELDFEKGKLILPNYFEPFERRNVKMTVVHKGKYDDYVAFKGDSDQDRPNLL